MTILEIANELVEILRPGCECIEIAGSIRRGKTTPKDIEIVAIPHFTEDADRDMFGNEYNPRRISWLEANILTALETGWGFDSAVRRNGPHYKRLMHYSGVACDLFITDARRWGAIYTIRTGPGEFSQMLVTRARRRGYRVHEGLLHGHTFRQNNINGEWKEIPCEKGDTCPLIIPTPTEKSFFDALNMAWIEPAARGVAAVIV